MKASFILILSLIISTQSFGQAKVESEILKGYFIINCCDSKIKSGCSLNIKTINAFNPESDSKSCGDGNFYKNISQIRYISPANIDLDQIDDFTYQCEIQKYQHVTYLSANPLILLDVNKGDSNILQNLDLVNSIKNNLKTAQIIQNQIDNCKLNFEKKMCYDVLMYGTLVVLRLADRHTPKTYTNPLGYNQHLILSDQRNKIKKVKILKNPFGL